jgi:peptide/nickel transport system substrate-binding protein
MGKDNKQSVVRDQYGPGHDRSVVDAFRNENSRRRFLQGMGATAAVGLAGCLGGNGNGDEEVGDDEEPPEDIDDIGDTLTLNAVQRFGTIDPAKGSDYTQVMAMVNLYDPLVFPDEEGDVQPHVAEDWEVSEDGLEYTFTLREDITFHSGNELTADDVAYSLERFLELGEGNSSLLTGIVDEDSVSVDGEYEVSITLEDVYSPFLSVLTLLFIVDQEEIEAEGEDEWGSEYLDDYDAGSGPFELDTFERGSHIVWSRFDDYWIDAPDGAFDNVRVEIIEEDATVRSLIRSGDLYMTSQYQSEETYNNLQDEEGFRVQEDATATLLYFKMNTQIEPTNDIEVRRAIAYGFDYETVREEISPGSEPAQGPVAPVFDAHNPDVEQPTYDPDYAREILEEAGYEEGELELVFTHVRDDDMQEQNALLFQQNMGEIGIDVEINPQTWGTMTELASSVEETPHVNHVFYGPIYPSEDAYLFNQYHSNAAGTWMSMEHLDDEEVDSLIDEARATVDDDERAQLYMDAQARIAELYPSVFLFVETQKLGFNDRVQGYTFRPAMSFDFWFHEYYAE